MTWGLETLNDSDDAAVVDLSVTHAIRLAQLRAKNAVEKMTAEEKSSLNMSDAEIIKSLEKLYFEGKV
jgi:hypothetical protein